MPYHPPLKIGSVEPFWPKIGHWEKMRYLFKMISTRPFPINLALIHPRHNPEGPWHPPDTHQTPNRHLTDSLKCMFFGRKQRKSTSWILRLLFNYFQLAWQIYPPYACQRTKDTIQTPSDTLQTPHKHPEIEYFLAEGGHWEKRQ